LKQNDIAFSSSSETSQKEADADDQDALEADIVTGAWDMNSPERYDELFRMSSRQGRKPPDEGAYTHANTAG
jgi:hypothetical protein